MTTTTREKELKEELHARLTYATMQKAAEWDNVWRRVGKRARAPLPGEYPNDYAREAMRDAKRDDIRFHKLAKLNMRGLDDFVLPQFEAMVKEAIIQENYNPLRVPLGELKQIDVLDDGGRLVRRDFVGQESFVKLMPNYRPGRRVIGFAQPADNRGRALNEYAHAQPPGRLVIHRGQVWGTTGEKAF